MPEKMPIWIVFKFSWKSKMQTKPKKENWKNSECFAWFSHPFENNCVNLVCWCSWIDFFSFKKMSHYFGWLNSKKKKKKSIDVMLSTRAIMWLFICSDARIKREREKEKWVHTYILALMVVSHSDCSGLSKTKVTTKIKVDDNRIYCWFVLLYSAKRRHWKRKYFRITIVTVCGHESFTTIDCRRCKGRRMCPLFFKSTASFSSVIAERFRRPKRGFYTAHIHSFFFFFFIDAYKYQERINIKCIENGKHK